MTALEPSGRAGHRERAAPILDTDLVIVGAGPVGLYGAYYAGFRGLRTTVVDALPELGGQITAMYPERLIHDVAGFPAIRGRDLVDGLIEQAARYDPTYLLGEVAESLTYDGERPLLRTSGGRTIRSKAIIITGGIGKFDPRPLPVGSQFAGRGLEYFVRHVSDYAGLDVVVVGGGDSAIDSATTLLPVARSITLVHRRGRLRADERSVQELRDSAARVLTSSELSAVHGNGRVEAVDIVHLPTNTVERLATQAIVAALGFVADFSPLETWGLDIRARRVEVATTMATNLPRVYAAGDVTAYPGKVRLIAVGFGEVALAVNNAAVAIDPSLGLFPGHSTR
jgi:ferredoxin/flavodoxin---NADP+ reductase